MLAQAFNGYHQYFNQLWMSFAMINPALIAEEVEVEQSASQLLEGNSSPSESEGKKKGNPNVCSNKICQHYKASKHNLAHENNIENLCEVCTRQYEKESYCLYCKQIYFDFSDDGKEWIMCDECERWVHTQCADFYPNNNAATFNCLKCKKIEVPQTTASAPTRRANNPTRNNTKVPERRKTQECMLNNFGFYWQLSPAELAEDVEKLKQFLK